MQRNGASRVSKLTGATVEDIQKERKRIQNKETNVRRKMMRAAYNINIHQNANTITNLKQKAKSISNSTGNSAGIATFLILLDIYFLTESPSSYTSSLLVCTSSFYIPHYSYIL